MGRGGVHWRRLRKAIGAFEADLGDALLGRVCAGCGGEAPRARPVCDACDAAISRSGAVLCLRCMQEGAPGDACAHGDSGSRLLAGPPYESPLDRILHAFKYAGARELHRWIAALVPEPPGRGLPVWREYLLVPVPLHPARRAWRGFDQAHLLASDLGRLWGIPVAEALVRVRDHEPQARTRAEARRFNVRDAFRLAPDASCLVRGRPILLVDDVATTGSTLLEAGRALEAAAPSWILALTASAGGLPGGGSGIAGNHHL